MIIRLLFFILVFYTSLSFAQSSTNLPHYLTEGEKRIMPQYLQEVRNGNRDGITVPPYSSVRTPAEWEEAQALCITWTSYPEILREIVRYAKEEVPVYITCSNAASVTTYLEAGGVEVDFNIVFFEESFNSIWIRDYGPWSVYTNDVDSLLIVDWIYNRPRPSDDVVPEHLSDFVGVPMYETTTAPYDLVHTGGNFMCDGLGTGFSSDLVIDENPSQTEANIDNIMNQFMGINRYIKMTKLPFDGIHHIDMHMKLLDEETILLGEYEPGISDGPQIEENRNYVRSNFLTPYGNPYKFIRVPMPPDDTGSYPNTGGDYRTFTNSIFINSTVLVPIYEEQYDTVALRIYEENLPGYNIVGIDCNDIIPASGALHCITKLIMTDDPLQISHAKVRDDYLAEDQIISAQINHRSGISTASVYYRTTPTDTYIELPMTDTGINNTWTATIPAQSFGTEVQYYIYAQANSGKEQTRPLPAPEGYFFYNVKALSSAPTVDFIYSANEALCPGDMVQFNDFSTAGVIEWLWSFEGGTPATATSNNPMVSYNEPGIYNVTLTVTNAIGSETLTIENAIIVDAVEGITPFYEDWSTGVGEDWEVINSAGDGISWELTAGVACNDVSLSINNFNNSNEGTTDILSINYDLTASVNNNLLFDLSYAPYNSSYFDRLQVVVEVCGSDDVVVFDKSGTTLATALSTTSEYEPGDCDDWRTELIDLSAFDGQIITVNFVNISGYGNNLYLDNLFVQGEENSPVLLTANTWLGGCYNTSTQQMTTHLYNNELISLSQPYNIAPWNYQGTEAFNAITDLPSNVVDWVLVEVRSATDINNVLEQKAALLLSDGSIISADASSNSAVTFYQLTEGEAYYLVLRHRNHLAVASNSPMVLPNASSFNFNDATQIMNGASQLMDLGDGNSGLTVGDFDADGVFTVHDYNQYTTQSSIMDTYTNADANLDGNITVDDYNLYQPNASTIGVPVIRY